MYSSAAFPHVQLTPAEQGVLHQGHNGWFDLKRSNYPQQWSDLIVYWRRKESVIEVKLEVIVSGRCGERWNIVIGYGVRLSDNKRHSYQWLGWVPKVGGCARTCIKSLWLCYASLPGSLCLIWIKVHNAAEAQCLTYKWFKGLCWCFC